MTTAPITHLFFDLHGTLVDGKKLHPCYSMQLGRILSERYGSTPDAWATANRQIMLDWDSYYADLDLAGEEGLAHHYEGLFRTTRAMFRLTKTEEPPHDVLKTLSRELPSLVTPHCDSFFPDAKLLVPRLHAKGYVLGVTTHAQHDQALGLLQGSGMAQYFSGEIIGIDTLEQYEKDPLYFKRVSQRAAVDPAQCLVIDDVPRYARAAVRAGMQAAFIARRRTPRKLPAVQYQLGDTLAGLDNILPTR